MPGRIDGCRICRSQNLEPVLDLGHIPPVDSFLSEEELAEPETHYPLKTVICRECGLVQLEYVVPKHELFHDDYAYDMSVTDAGARHFREMAGELDGRYPDHGSVLDIGSNTGVLLEGFQEQGWEVLGVEPSGNVYERAVERGIPTENRFFSSESARDILDEHGTFDLVTATNVFAHIEDLHDAVEGIKTLLSAKGVFVFEVPYLVDLVENNEFDTIYHEHLSYFSVKPLVRLFEEHGLEIIDIEKQDIHGGSLRVHVSREGDHQKTGEVERFREKEREKRIHSVDRLEEFAEDARSNRRELVQMVNRLRQEGCSIAAVGAPAKGVTLLNYCGFDRETIPYVTEKSDLKIGRYVPGTHNRVVPDEKLLEEQPDYAVLLPWNFSESIMENLREYLDSGGKFIVPVPEPRIVEEPD